MTETSTTTKPGVLGFDGCLYDVLRDVVYEEGGVIFGTAAEAAAYAIQLAEWQGQYAGDASVRTVYENGIRERIWESAANLAGGAA